MTPDELCEEFCKRANVIMPLKADDSPETTCAGAYRASEKYNMQNLKNQDTFEIYID